MTTPIALPFISLQFWTEVASVCGDFLAQVTEDLAWFGNEQSYGLMDISDRETREMARQGLDVDFDADDISTAEYMKVMKKKQDIQNRFQREREGFMLKCKRKEDDFTKHQQRVQLKYDNAQAQKETWREVCQNIDCSYGDK